MAKRIPGLPLDEFVAEALQAGALDPPSLPRTSYSSSSTSSSSDSDSSSSGSEDDSRSQYQFHNRRLLTEMATMRDSLFKRLFGVSRQTFRDLCDDTHGDLPLGQSSNGRSLSQDERWAYFLHSMRGNEFNAFKPSFDFS